MATGVRGEINLQATLSASSASSVATTDPEAVVMPHHPITCTTELAYHEDGSFGCQHVTVGPDDERTRHCLNHTVALLLIEEATRRFQAA